MIPIKAIIFDMDGVLVDSEPFHVENEKRMFKKMGLDISDEEHVGYMGTATDVMWAKIIKDRNLPHDVVDLTILTIQEGLPFFRSLEKIEPMPGLTELLKKLQAKKIPLAVASSSDVETIRIILDKSGLKKYFLYAVSSSEVGKSKPEPDIFLHTATLLSVKPEECLVIEDSTNGIRAAKSANMVCVAYSGASADNQDQSLADEQIADYSDLESTIEKYMQL